MKSFLRLPVRQLSFQRGFKKIAPSFFEKSRTYSDNLLAEDKSFLSRFAGGSVDLTKDESTGIATITLNHTERKNAFSGKMMTDLHDVVVDLEQWKSGRGVLLHGAASTFCSGGDLNVLKNLIETEGGGCIMSRFLQNTLARLYQLPLVSLAFIEGRALGGGAEVAVSCDLRAMTNDAQIGFVQCAVGLSLGWGGGTKLVEIVGRTNAIKLLSSAAVLSANDALNVGLADQIVSNKSEAIELLKTFTQRGKTVEVQQAAKRVVLIGMSELSFEDKMNKEYDIFEQIFGGPALRKALSSNLKFSKQS